MNEVILFDNHYYMSRIDKKKYKQILIIIILVLNRIVIESIFNSPSFYFQVPKFRCKDGNFCKEIKACEEYNNKITDYLIEFHSIISEYKLFCSSDEFKRKLYSIANFIASILTFIYMMIFDFKGRKKGIIFCNINSIIGLLLILFGNYYLKLAGFSILRVSCFLNFGLSNVYLNEFIIEDLKYQAFNYTSSIGTAGSFLNSLIGFLFNSYKDLLIIQIILSILSVISCYYLIEPPIFYFIKKDIINLKKTFKKICKNNKIIKGIDFKTIEDDMLKIKKLSFKETLNNWKKISKNKFIYENI